MQIIIIIVAEEQMAGTHTKRHAECRRHNRISVKQNKCEIQRSQRAENPYVMSNDDGINAR